MRKEINYFCEICGEKFKDKYRCKAHENSHICINELCKEIHCLDEMDRPLEIVVSLTNGDMAVYRYVAPYVESEEDNNEADN